MYRNIEYLCFEHEFCQVGNGNILAYTGYASAFTNDLLAVINQEWSWIRNSDQFPFWRYLRFFLFVEFYGG